MIHLDESIEFFRELIRNGEISMIPFFQLTRSVARLPISEGIPPERGRASFTGFSTHAIHTTLLTGVNGEIY